MNDDFNGHGPDERKRPSLSPLTLEELQGLVEETVNEQEYVKRHLDTLETDVRTLVAGTSSWQRDINVQLQRIEGCVERLTNQMKLTTNRLQVIQFSKEVVAPVLTALFSGAVFAELIWLIIHR